MSDTYLMLAPPGQLDALDRLDLVDWDEVHEAAQATLELLDSAVARLVPDVRVMPGRNSARAWNLFTYRVYRPPVGSEIDPVVVGVNFARGDTGVIVKADIAGETRGDVLLELPATEVVGKLTVMERSLKLCAQLAGEGAAVARAITDRNREV